MGTVRTAKKLLLGKELEHMIRSAGKTQTEAAAIIESAQSRIAQLIAGAGNLSVGDLELLARSLGFGDEAYLETLRELRRDNHRRGFWSTGYRRAYREDLRLLIDLEKHADQLKFTSVEVMPGLVQCEAYVRALHQDVPDEGGLTLEDRVEARVSRQAILDEDEPPTAHFVLSESCLRRVWGDRDVMREQLNHLIKLSNRPNVMVQVMPFDRPAGRRSPIGHRFALLRVPSPGAAGPLELAYIESQAETRYVDDKQTLAEFDRAWARLSTAALSYAESRKFMRRVLREFSDEG